MHWTPSGSCGTSGGFLPNAECSVSFGMSEDIAYSWEQTPLDLFLLATTIYLIGFKPICKIGIVGCGLLFPGESW